MKINLRKIRHLYPFPSQFVCINGHNYHYLDEGGGEPVVMLHGNPTWSFYFRNIVTAISPVYRCIVPDHTGCGLSDKPSPREYAYRLENRVNDLEALINHLNLPQKLTLMVHDWGGMIGMTYAVRHPERISRLIITNTAGFLKPSGKPLPVRLWLIRNLVPFAVPAVLGLNLFARAALYMAPYRRLSPAVKQGLVAPYNSPANRMATLKFVQDIPIRPGDPGYAIAKATDDGIHALKNLPMLICWGKHDFVFDDDYFAEWRARFPNAEAHYFEDGGHYLLEDKPAEVAALVSDFLKRTS